MHFLFSRNWSTHAGSEPGDTVQVCVETVEIFATMAGTEESNEFYPFSVHSILTNISRVQLNYFQGVSI